MGSRAILWGHKFRPSSHSVVSLTFLSELLLALLFLILRVTEVYTDAQQLPPCRPLITAHSIRLTRRCVKTGPSRFNYGDPGYIDWSS